MNFPPTSDNGMDVDTDEDSLVDNGNPVKIGILGEQNTAGGDRGPARKKSKNWGEYGSQL